MKNCSLTPSLIIVYWKTVKMLQIEWKQKRKSEHGTKVFWPLPPFGNRDKLHFSGVEFINTIWPLLIQYNNINYCLILSIEKLWKCYKLSGNRNTKVNMGQKNFDPSLHKDMSHFWWSKKGDIFYPPPFCMFQCHLLVNFFWRHP